MRFFFFLFSPLLLKALFLTSVQGLQKILRVHKPPKDLLQTCLRPTLFNLGDYRKLTVPLLNGLARFLERLKNCFNITLGEKLLEHFKKRTDPHKVRCSLLFKFRCLILNPFFFFFLK